MKVLVIMGTRPEVIKLAPVIWALQKVVDCKVCSTGQHRSMLHAMIESFSLTIDYHLDVMVPDQSLVDLSAKVLSSIQSVYQSFQPNLVIVQGDTTTAMVASLAAYYMKIPIAHVEAGLRTHDLHAPFPEEGNRRLIAQLADFHFCPTEQHKNNLLLEHCPLDHIFVTGNTVIDSLFWVKKHLRWDDAWSLQFKSASSIVKNKSPYILLTTHRRENIGGGLSRIFESIRVIAESYPELAIVFPVHLNPRIRQQVAGELSGYANIHLIEPLDYHPFIYLMSSAKAILTDSGGVQEEASAFSIPVLVLREKTERTESLNEGLSKLVGTRVAAIVQAMRAIMDGEGQRQLDGHGNLYGDGMASHRIMTILCRHFNIEHTMETLCDFQP